MEYMPNTADDHRAMLATIGVARFEDLLTEIPARARLNRPLTLPPALSELEVRREIGGLLDRNAHADRSPCFLGAGAYDHAIPSIVPFLTSRSEFSTSYTPYQAEMSQGMLQTIFEFQTMVCELTGMDVANASMYDGASALAEAALMACRVTKRSRIVAAGTIHPHHRAVLATYLSGISHPVHTVRIVDGRADLDDLRRSLTDDTAAVLVQHPNFMGNLEDVAAIAEAAHGRGALAVASVDPLSLGLLAPPGFWGADVAVGEGQALGNPMSFGGPFVGFMATKKDFMRQIPGRIVGATVDTKGRPGYCLTLQAREQHIRRERATSNICTNQALMALTASIYLATLGPSGLREVGEQCVAKSHYAAERIAAVKGFARAAAAPFFKEFVVRTPRPPAEINAALLKAGIIGGLDLGRFDTAWTNHWLVCVTEKRTREEIDRLVEVIGNI
ncbi:MAG TPA: aminomethyl-transferring glycine dehydrogenase subunit GcvPA [Nitrospiria bacterium]|nr:aminomethyl-transferring glycine dehydrogenase subunit GcvPA [Nitrospiria bacterium]